MRASTVNPRNASCAHRPPLTTHRCPDVGIDCLDAGDGLSGIVGQDDRATASLASPPSALNDWW